MEKDVYELTNAQKSIWNTELFYNGSNINNICGTINIFEPLDINALKEALHLIVAENDNLHAQFYIKDGCIYQSFKKDLDYNIDVLEISSKTDLRKLERKMRSHIFDIQIYLILKFSNILIQQVVLLLTFIILSLILGLWV